MFNWNQLNGSLDSVDARHKALFDKFDCFARQALEKINHPKFHIKGIDIEPLGDKNHFVVKFAGRTIRFQFYTAFGEGAVLVGIVNCYLVENFPEPGYQELGSFKFSASGKTGFFDDVGDPILIDTDVGALYIVLNYIYKSLEQFEQEN